MNQGDKATELAPAVRFRTMRPVGEHAAGARVSSAIKPGRAFLDADSYTAGRASDSKRRAITVSMIPYCFASSAVKK
jgi:hypothetical protein